MSEVNNQSRRRLLKMLSGAPMLPLASFGSLGLLTACGGDDDDDEDTGTPVTPPPVVTFTSAAFTSMAAPNLSEPAKMATTLVESAMELTFSDGSKETMTLAYKPFFITGDLVPDGNGGTMLSGGYYDINNKPIIDTSVPGSERQFFSNCPDGMSMLALENANVPGITGKPVFVVVQFEYNDHDLAGNSTYGQLPSPIGVLTLDQDQATGNLTLVKYHNVDTSSVHGLWITCGASLSPWNTHLSSEEYEPDAAAITSTTRTDAAALSVKKSFAAFSQRVYNDPAVAKPYHYGHMPEITVQPDGTGKVVKHYCMGRISHELVEVMPDNQTVLMGDDYTNGGLFMFVADRPKDLSSGHLYVARYAPGLSLDVNAAGAGMQWIKMGHATSAEIEALADRLVTSDIMDVRVVDPVDATFTKVFSDGVANWVKLVPGMEQAAAFLETHRYADLLGASMAFTKMEGTTVNAKDKIAYSALANIQASMIQGDKTWRESANIALPKVVKAGGILAHTLAGSQVDTKGGAIGSEWVPTSSKMLLLGEDIAADALGNTANPDNIASPDNIKFSEKLRTLFIGEDSGNHVNNFLWAYNVDTKALSRILSTPAGAEATGLQAVDEINGWTYITANFQHAGDWGAIHNVVKPVLDPLIKANYKDGFGAAVGCLTAVSLEKKTTVA